MLKLQGHRGKVRAVAFSPDGRQLASVAGHDRHVSLWQLPRGCTLSPFCIDEIQALAFSPDGSAIVTATGRYLHHWDLAAGILTHKWRRGANYCWQVAFSPDGSQLVASCFNKVGATDRFRVDVFPVSVPERKSFLAGDYGFPMCMAFSSSGRFLAVGSEDKKVRIWSMKEKAKPFVLECVGKARAVAFSADEKLVAVSQSKQLMLYDLATRWPCGELVGHTGYVTALSASPDGKLLSAGDDGTARLWDVATQRERECFDWKIGALNVAAFSRDGTLAAVGGDSEIVVWDVK